MVQSERPFAVTPERWIMHPEERCRRAVLSGVLIFPKQKQGENRKP